MFTNSEEEKKSSNSLYAANQNQITEMLFLINSFFSPNLTIIDSMTQTSMNSTNPTILTYSNRKSTIVLTSGEVNQNRIKFHRRLFSHTRRCCAYFEDEKKRSLLIITLIILYLSLSLLMINYTMEKLNLFKTQTHMRRL